MWLDNGVRVVWAVHPQTRTVDVYRKDTGVITFTEDDYIDCGDIMPGFSCLVSDIFHQ